ncbi:F-actin-monooxygenase Mical isoform X2 [Microplitis demolitor]|uniref:F-actin-monooxygenase Mical isoform X2 n=1 Tax=Microplitis demolitor TaxID=69319 RepID=UPI0004CD0D90|nr:F-actin-monooxygenase Mical isoform X2 [Microplitis demolitor]
MMQDHGHQSSRKTLVASPEVAMASEVFDLFCNAATLKSILGHFRHLCDLLNMRPNAFPQFYPKFKSKLRSWKAQALWKKFDQRANHKCYNRGKACPNSRVLIIGGGPCGLRAAIEAQLLGAKVVVVEKRDRMSRNNVLHLWPFVIQDLRALGAKKFFGKFCAGSIDHISIRQLQCILLKVALILGVEFHEGVSFDALIPPPENQDEGKIGWRAKTTPHDHPVSQYEFDVLIGADGKRNTLEGFKRKEFRGKLAIAITANFINKRTEAEARVEEISGVAFIFNQKFFKELYQETGIDLENIVYYKDDTHYFVMTAKKHSLIDKGVILQDHADTAKLLAKENVDRDALMLYAREAADFSTQYQMMDMEFAVNHYGQPDVAMFDFTSMYAAENASRVIERHGHRLLMTLVGDSLLEPFWPTGSGCARGFLSSMDAGWAIKGWGASLSPLEVLAERESIYRLLGQTTPENLNRDYAAYTLDPHTRYPNLNVRSVSTIQVRGLLDTDDPDNIKPPSVQSSVDVPKKRRRRDTQIHPDTLLHWLQKQVALYDNVKITDMTSSFKDGMAVCAIVHRYRPDLIDFNSLKSDDVEKNNQLAYDVLEKELGISPIMTGEEMAQCDVPDKLAMFSYLTQIYEAFRGEIPHIKHPKLEPEIDDNPLFNKQLGQTLGTKVQLNRLPKHETPIRPRHSRFSRHNNENIQAIVDKKTEGSLGRRSRKRRSNEKMGATVEERQKRLEDIVNNRNERMRRKRFLRKMATQQFYKSLQMLQANAKRDKEEPFEDYSIFLYRQTAPDFKDRVKELEQKILYPDREPKMLLQHKGGMDDDFSGRIKDIEDKLRGTTSSEKKPRDLLRAIGKIEKTDWNVKEIEKKIEENKLGKGVRQDKVERVPKWSREQFLARQIKMEKKGRDPNEPERKYAEIDNTLKCIDRKIKEGNILGHNKVSAMAEQFANKNQDTEQKVQRSNSKAAIILPTQGGSEMCHFCDKRVYLMERLTAEGKFFHRGCFRCEYCSTSLRIGNHTFDRDKNGGRFYCTQHFGLPGTIKTRIERKKLPLLNKENIPETSEKKKLTVEKVHTLKPPLDGVAGLDLLDRGQTPERIEFENLAEMSDAEEAHSQMDEDEWTDRNFGASAAEMGSSDDISDMSDSDEENEIYEEAIDQPLTTEGTIELAKNWTLRYSHPHTATGNSDTGSNEYEDSSDEYTSEDEESGTATEDEEDVRARELRKQEVWLKVPPRESDTETGSETEVASDEDSSEDRRENSATEISTDSEFEHDGTTPTQNELPEITINDCFIRKTRGQYVEPKKVQVKSKIISPVNGKIKPDEKHETGSTNKTSIIKTNNLPVRPVNVNAVPLVNPRKGDYLLNRTHSTEGIASKLSLELKKRYLLGGSVLGGTVMKSGSTSNVDTKLRNLTDSISQYQKLLNPAPEPSPTMQAFLQGTNKLRSTSNIPLSPIASTEILTRSPLKTIKLPEINTAKEHTNISLPDLIKETNIMKSKTDPNIICTGPVKEVKEIDINKKEDIEEKDVSEVIIKEQVPETRNEQVNKNEKIGSSCGVNEDSHSKHFLHEASADALEVKWSKVSTEKQEDDNSSDDSEMDSDSLSSNSKSDANKEKNRDIENKELEINLSSRSQIHSTPENLLIDNQDDKFKEEDMAMTFEPDSIECFLNVRDEMKEEKIQNPEPSRPINLWSRSSNDDNKNSVYDIETVNNNFKHIDLKENRSSISNCSSPTSMASIISNKQDDSVENDVTTAALTETEFSEWARDGEELVAADLKDAEFDISSRGNLSLNKLRGNARIAKEEEDLTDIDTSERIFSYPDRTEIPTNDTSKLLVNGEDLDYMDTDNESLLDSLRDATNIPLIKNRGYVEFVNVTGILSSSPKKCRSPHVDAPIAKAEAEPELCSDEDKYDDNVIKINLVTVDDVRNRLSNCTIKPEQKDNDKSKEESLIVEAINHDVVQSMDEDSLLVVEPAEDTTTSELTTILASPVGPVPESQIIQSKVSNESCKLEENNPDYLEYVKRLQSRIAEFSNAKDSIDVRKSKRKNSKNALQERSAEIISEEIKSQGAGSNQSYNSPATSRKLEEITRERSKQKNLIQDLLMDKIEAHKQKSAEKKAKRAARNASFNSGMQLFSPKPPLDSPEPSLNQSSITTSATSTPTRTTFAEAKKSLDTPGANEKQFDAKKSQESSNNDTIHKKSQGNIYSDENNSDKMSKMSEKFKTPIAPPRSKHEEARRTAEKAKQEARERARLKSDEDLGLSPEDRIKQLRLKVTRRQLSMEDRRKCENEIIPDLKTRAYSFTFQKSECLLQPSKSTDNMKALAKKMAIDLPPATSAKSMSELVYNKDSDGKISLDTVVKRDKKKTKDPERRKSIIQAVSDFFKKKDTTSSPTSPKDKTSGFCRLTTRLKERGKIDKLNRKWFSDECDIDKLDRKFDERPKSVCEAMLIENLPFESSPPVPPPPLNYPECTVHISDDSLSEEDSKMTSLSYSQLQKNANVDGSCNSISRKLKNTKKLVRQAQLKRLRTAQEIQRKLEETEVKQRDLESRGVSVEKALRGEGESSGREETDLLGEWFDLMRERTELRRYEKELLVRAQEVQLEDRHDRLQQELRERLADDDEKKTSADVKKEGEILTEMLEIAAKRDSLIALLEEERQRWRRLSCPTFIAHYCTSSKQSINSRTLISILHSPIFILTIIIIFIFFFYPVDIFLSYYF